MQNIQLAPSMYSVLLFPRVLLLLLCVALVVRSSPTCSTTVHSLQDIYQATADSVCVELQPGIHYVNYTDTEINNVSVVLIGNEATIRCDPAESEITLPLTNYTRFPLTFSNADYVRIENVHFQYCLRPVKFESVSNVTLVNTTFE